MKHDRNTSKLMHGIVAVAVGAAGIAALPANTVQDYTATPPGKLGDTNSYGRGIRSLRPWGAKVRNVIAAWSIGRHIFVGLALWMVSIGEPDGASFHCPNSWPLRRAFIAYDSSAVHYSDQLLDYLAARFEFTDEINAYNIQRLKQRNPNFYALIRNSLSDNFVPPAAPAQTQEHDWFMAHATEYGADPEDTYLHFWTDTDVIVEGQTIVIPGWQSDSPKVGATGGSRAESRVPVYYKDLTRRATNFSTPQIRAAHRAYNLSLVAQPIADTTYWEGFFFDNAGNYNLMVTIVTNGQYPNGGQLAEHPTHAVMNTPAFRSWYWYQGIGLFMKEFREWVEGHPPQLQGRQLKIVPNVYNLPALGSPDWESAYVTFHPADALFQEFEVNPTRDAARTFPAIIFQENSVAQAAGIDLFQPGFSVTTLPLNTGSYTSDEALMNTVSLHWLTRTPNVLVLGHQSNNVMNADWQQNMKGIFDVDLGPPLGDPYVLVTGADNHSPPYAYMIYARKFSCGLAIVRERGASNEDIDFSTSVSVQLPDQYIPVDVDGMTHPEMRGWNLRNGQGQMFISPVVVDPPSNNFSGLWWASPAGSESGWGINFAHQGDIIFASWFTYDLTGKGWWLTMTAPKVATGMYSGALYVTTGPAFNAVPFNPAQVKLTQVGTGTLSFRDANDGTFAYTVNGVSQMKSITHQVFGPLPVCATATTSVAAATNYTDLWWASPAGSEAGWGSNLTQEGTTIFATWFTYDLDGTPLWLSVTAPNTAPGVYAGTLYRTIGPAFDAVPFNPAKVVLTSVGMATFTFSDGNDASFAYDVNGTQQVKSITRQVFQSPGTVCQ